MHSTGAGPSKKRGQYATRACNGCRRRRCKCDAVHPACGTCTFYGHECLWSREDDARRPATKQLVETLRTKIQVLEAEVARLQVQTNTGEANLVVPSNTVTLYPSNARNQADLVPTQFLVGSSESSTFPQLSQHAMTKSPITSSIPSSSWPVTQNELPYTEHPATTVISHYVSQPIYQYIFCINTSVPAGELPEGARLSLDCDWSCHLPPLGDAQLSRHEHDTLLQRFFNYQILWLLPLVPQLFLHNMLYANTHPASLSSSMSYYSPLLHCSLLAFATALSDDPQISSIATRGKFATRAKELLDNEFAHPTQSLVQALAILAEYCSGIGERHAGYMYLGMSIRAARALGLFTENQSGAGVQVSPSPEAMSRGWSSWSVFAQDKLVALEYGRNYDVPLPYAGTRLPVVDPGFDNQSWPWLPPQAPVPADAQPNRTTLVFRESCKLMTIVTRIADSIYYDPGINDAPEDSTAINLHLQLDSWFNDLPKELLISVRSNSTALPHVIMLNICYWWTLMYLHRPFYQRGQILDHTNHDSRLFTDLSIKMCDRAAHKIAILTCGTTLLLQGATISESAVKKRSTAQEGVNACTRALRVIASTWPYAAQLAEQLEGPLSEQAPQLHIAPSSASQPSPLETSTEQESDDQEVSNMFYRFIHEWSRDEPESPYSSGIHSQESSPMIPSTYPQLGESPSEPFGQAGWDQGHFPTSPLSYHGALASHPSEGVFYDEQGEQGRH